MGIIPASDTASLGDADALNLVFHSEVSASSTVTEISGRGLGMAILRAKTEKLGGRVSIDSKRHAGTTFRITLPLTLATFRGVLVTVAERIFVVPSISVERVLRVRPQDIQTVENRQVVSLEGRSLSLASLEATLGLTSSSSAIESSMRTIMILHGGEQRIGFIVDEVLRDEEVLVKTFRKPLVRVRNIAGATLLGSGKVVPVLNVTDLMQSARTHGARPTVIAAEGKRSKRRMKKVLVVEDSITSRMLLKGILEGANYEVKTAVDGMEAFTLLCEDRFDLVVSDVEMPRLNGIDLANRIRGRQTACRPSRHISHAALETREERARGMDAGASAYIIKSSFDQSNLLEAVRRLI